MPKLTRKRIEWILWMRWIHEQGAPLRLIARFMKECGPEFRWGTRRVKWSAQHVANQIRRAEYIKFKVRGATISLWMLPIPPEWRKTWVPIPLEWQPRALDRWLEARELDRRQAVYEAHVEFLGSEEAADGYFRRLAERKADAHRRRKQAEYYHRVGMDWRQVLSHKEPAVLEVKAPGVGSREGENDLGS